LNLYVGNLSFETVEADLRAAFGAFGLVTRARIISDKLTTISKGFGFVDMANDVEGQAALIGLSGSMLGGHTLKVNEVFRLREMHPRSKNRPDAD
jgi:RNA recognition motif-containing protein